MKKFLVVGALILCSGFVAAQPLTVDAGTNTVICPGLSYTLGGTPTASGGTSPYSYSWTPSSSLNNANIANPVATPSVPTWYYLTVVDAANDTVVDSVAVILDPIYAYNAGPDTAICIGDSIRLGGQSNSFAGGVTYSWAPATGLSSSSAPRPMFTDTVSRSYTLTITSPNCPSKVFNITVTVNPLPVVDASGATTINEGQSTPLTVTGATTYFWIGPYLSNSNSSLTNAEPIVTTTYLVYGVDDNGCQNWDTVTVKVNPDSAVYLYNTFTPNNDGINDYFFVGNIDKYPQNRLEVYDRTGQQVYAKTGYDNSWDGTNYGDRLPETTYFFTLDLGDGSPVLYGHVTILR